MGESRVHKLINKLIISAGDKDDADKIMTYRKCLGQFLYMGDEGRLL